MKKLNARQLRSEISDLGVTLALEHELVLASNGEAVGRMLPMPGKRAAPSLAEHRSKMTMVGGPSEVLIREERDRR